MKLVLDSSAFFSGIELSGELYTTPLVVNELKDLRSKARFDLLGEAGLRVIRPGKEAFVRVRDAASRWGEGEALSGTDREVLALAIELDASILTDDYALQNVAGKMGLAVVPLLQKGARGFLWRFKCSGCGKYAEGPGECPVCGALIKRKLK
jgi:UPF0271 protein